MTETTRDALTALNRRAVIAGLAGLAMTGAALPAFAADAGFVRWINQFAAVARTNGIPAEIYRQAFAGINTPDPDVLRLATKQPEFTKSVGEYLSTAVSEQRITTGRKMLGEYKNALSRIYAMFGVEPQIVLAIWGVETSYGAVLNNPKIVRSVIRSLATLAYAGGPRADFGRTQLLAALKILQHHDVAPRGLTGSWAGAMGQTQFIPTSFLKYAVDLDGDGRRDIWNSVPDALATTANLLAQNGWQRGVTWGYEVQVPRGFNFAYADEKTARTLATWESLGVRRTGGRKFPRPDDVAKMILPSGARGPAFLVLKNFDVIKAYNNSTSYALAVGYLADRIVGAPPFTTPWPTDIRPLSMSEVTEMQERLTARGFPTGSTDGRVGPDTRTAVRAYQMAIGVPPDGYPTPALLASLRAPR